MRGTAVQACPHSLSIHHLIARIHGPLAPLLATKLKAALINALWPTAVCRPTSCMYDCTHNGVVRGETHSLHSRRRRRQMTYLALMFMQCSCISWPPNGPCTAGQIIMNSLAHASRQRRAYVGGIALPIRVRLGYRVPSGVLGALLFAVVRQPS